MLVCVLHRAPHAGCPRPTTSFLSCVYCFCRLANKTGRIKQRRSPRDPRCIGATPAQTQLAAPAHPLGSFSSIAMASLRIVGLSGSLRAASVNSALLHEVAQHFPAGVTFEIVSCDLPLFNQDLESDLPQSVADFKAKIQGADAFLFACPEYNYSVSGVLKNAIDWASRNPNGFAGKPAGIVGAGGGAGTARSQHHLRQIGVFLDLHFLNKPEVLIKAFEPGNVDWETGKIVNEATKAVVADFAKTFAAFADKHRADKK
eukprot:m.174904 g.174904  ORF g.174904 m.174904 type:complete len:259 (+) comp10418_c0_seq2:1503-2279(+)